MSGLTLDAGALIGLERKNRRVIALLAEAGRRSVDVTIPATVLAQVIRAPERQVTLARFLRASSSTVVGLDHPAAVAVGRLLAESGTSDIADAHVVAVASDRSQTVVTSDADDMAALTRLRGDVPAVTI